MSKPRLICGLILLIATSAAQRADASIGWRSSGALTSMFAPKVELPTFPVAPSIEAPIDISACVAPIQHKRLRGRIDRAVVKVAQKQLSLPMGSGRYVSVGGQRYLFCLEPHYHEPGHGKGPEGWHKGVTAYDAS